MVVAVARLTGLVERSGGYAVIAMKSSGWYGIISMESASWDTVIAVEGAGRYAVGTHAVAVCLLHNSLRFKNIFGIEDRRIFGFDVMGVAGFQVCSIPCTGSLDG